MPIVYFITHPDVVIDPQVPVPEWRLSPRGRERMADFCRHPFVRRITSVYASAERKALDGGEILAAANGLALQVRPALHENDRSATGYLPPDEFRATADAFFDRPNDSIRGWETAADAQSRIVACVERIAREETTSGDIGIVSHGGVATLLLCRLLDHPISRTLEQPGTKGGNYFAFDRTNLALLHQWKDIADA
jgi:broad specificity phosphatase PhoE